MLSTLPSILSASTTKSTQGHTSGAPARSAAEARSGFAALMQQQTDLRVSTQRFSDERLAEQRLAEQRAATPHDNKAPSPAQAERAAPTPAPTHEPAHAPEPERGASAERAQTPVGGNGNSNGSSSNGSTGTPPKAERSGWGSQPAPPEQRGSAGAGSADSQPETSANNSTAQSNPADQADGATTAQARRAAASQVLNQGLSRARSLAGAAASGNNGGDGAIEPGMVSTASTADSDARRGSANPTGGTPGPDAAALQAWLSAQALSAGWSGATTTGVANTIDAALTPDAIAVDATQATAARAGRGLGNFGLGRGPQDHLVDKLASLGGPASGHVGPGGAALGQGPSQDGNKLPVATGGSPADGAQLGVLAWAGVAGDGVAALTDPAADATADADLALTPGVANAATADALSPGVANARAGAAPALAAQATEATATSAAALAGAASRSAQTQTQPTATGTPAPDGKVASLGNPQRSGRAANSAADNAPGAQATDASATALLGPGDGTEPGRRVAANRPGPSAGAAASSAVDPKTTSASRWAATARALATGDGANAANGCAPAGSTGNPNEAAAISPRGPSTTAGLNLPDPKAAAAANADAPNSPAGPGRADGRAPGALDLGTGDDSARAQGLATGDTVARHAAPPSSTTTPAGNAFAATANNVGGSPQRGDQNNEPGRAIDGQRTADAPLTSPGLPAASSGSAAVGGNALTPTFASVLSQAAPAEARIAVPLDSPGFAPALGAQVSLFARDGVQTAWLQLNPAEMGPISVQIAIDGNAARVDFQADMAATRDVIEASLPALAGALQDAGLTLAGGGVFQQPQGRQPQPEPGPQTPTPHGRERLGSADASATAQSIGRALPRARGLVDLVA